MIFSKLFKAKWQHKDSNVRIAAINDELSLSIVDDKKILTTLLQEDDNELVRRSVLLKFNDFTIWLKASNENSNKKIREYAQKKVEAILLGQDNLILTAAQKLEFIEKTDKTSLLEALLKVEQDDDLIITLYQKLQKPQLLTSLFKSKSSAAVQLFLVSQVSQQELLEKLLKFAKHQSVTDVIEEKIANIVAAELKPIKLRKQTQLVLSKFLALKELSHYQEVVDKKAKLESEWQLLIADFSCLEASEGKTFIDKYQSIEAQLTTIFAIKAEAFQQQQIEKKLAQDKQQDKENFTRQLKEYAHAITTAIFEDNKIDEQQFTEQLDIIVNAIQGSSLNGQEQKVFLTDVEKLQRKLSKLPEIAQSITQATHLVSKISQVALPSTIAELPESSALYNDWLAQWRQIDNTASGILPDSIVNAYQEIVVQWQGALKPLFKEQDKQLNVVRKKLADVKRLISQGKYHAAFGVFNKANQGYQLLSLSQQNKVTRDYNSAQEKIAELSDWEHYIATPRKQKLLEKINELVEQPLDNPNEQAAKVKEFRQLWNSLGHADDDVEKSLNNEFNLASEKAFAPCRLYFAEQEKLREQHLTTRNQLLMDAKHLSEKVDDDQISMKLLEGELNKLHQKWRDAGEVDREKYKSLNQEFSLLLKPVKGKVTRFHRDNYQRKEQLIEQAEQASQLEDVKQAVNHVKNLQNQWKTVGYCSKNAEHSLWKKFRAINDTVFAKRKAHFDETQANKNQLVSTFSAQLETIANVLTQPDTQETLTTSLKQLMAVKSQVEQESIKEKTLFNSIASLTRDIENRLIQIRDKAEQQKWLNLFYCIDLLANSQLTIESSPEFSTLSSSWKKQLLETSVSEHEFDRRNKTLELEIIAGVPSPEEFKTQRMAVQVTLMKEQMSSGQRVSIEQALVEWLALGKLTAQDNVLIERIKGIYCK